MIASAPSSTQVPTPNVFASYAGVDLHKTVVMLTAVDGHGEPISRLKTQTKCRDRITQWIAALPQPVHLAIEACPFLEWFIDDYRPLVEQELGGRFDIADATELASRRGKRRKTDRNDALDIARQLARGECPLGWIADDHIVHIRKLGRQWHRLSRTLSRAKHTLRSMLMARNIAGPCTLHAASGHRWLLAHGDLLKPADQRSFGQLLEIVALIERQREPLRREIIRACRDERIAPVVERLKTVPGIDVIWACIIAAEVGDFLRFPNADALEFWAGLTPDNKESAGRTTSGEITKAGSRTLRWAVCKAGVTLCRSDGRQEAKRQRILARTGRAAKANVAMGRQLLRILHAMFRHGTDYQVGEPINRTEQANRARLGRKRCANKRRSRKS